MTKESLLTLRVDEKVKRRIVEAARRQGKSITNFVLEAAMSSVHAVEKNAERKQTKVRRGACPTFFKAVVLTARAGGERGYETAGFELTRHLGDLVPYELEDDEWTVRVEELERLLEDAAVDEKVFAWFEANLPSCTAMIPTRRRDRFIEGVRAYAEEHDL